MEELFTSFDEIVTLITNKKTSFLDEYQKKTEEIILLKKELSEKKFEDNNFNNVSMLRNQDKKITELNNKIELFEKRNANLQEKNQSLEQEIKSLKNEKLEKKSKKTKRIVKKKTNEKKNDKKENNIDNKNINENTENIDKNTENNKVDQNVEISPLLSPKAKEELNNSDTEVKVKKPKKKLIIKKNNSKSEEKNIENDTKSKEIVSNKKEQYIDEVPDIDDMDVFSYKDVEYYYSTKSYYIYEIANDDGDIGERLGTYKLNGESLEDDGLDTLELEEGGFAVLEFF